MCNGPVGSHGNHENLPYKNAVYRPGTLADLSSLYRERVPWPLPPCCATFHASRLPGVGAASVYVAEDADGAQKLVRASRSSVLPCNLI